MKKTYRVKNKKKQVHEFRAVANVAEYLDALREYSDRTIFAWKEHGEAHELTYGELLENVRCLALALTATYGENAHRVIGIIGETSANWIISYLAILSSGNVALPLDKELAHEELSKFLAVADAAGIVYSATFNDVMPEIADGHPTLTNLFPMAPAENTPAAVGNAVVVSYDRMLRIGLDSDREFIPDTDTERMAQILFTSGTTGSSKCVMLCQRNIFSVVTSACTQVYFCKEDVLVSVLPLHHTYELACTLAAANYGAKICINDSIRHALKNFKEYQPTGLVLVPLFVTTMYKKIQSEAKRSGKDKILAVGTKVASKLSLAGIDLSDKIFKDVREAFGGRLHKIICGGAALSPELIATFEAFGISIYEGYGITECSPLVAVTPYWKRKPGTVGPAVPCCEIRIDGVQENDKGYISGEIQVRGDNVMLGYMNNDEANAEAFTDDGWFRTGDIGYLDKDGYLAITGREKSVIVLDNGKNVFPKKSKNISNASTQSRNP